MSVYLGYVCMQHWREMYSTDLDKIGTKIVNYAYVRIALRGVLEDFKNQPHIQPSKRFFFHKKALKDVDKLFTCSL